MSTAGATPAIPTWIEAWKPNRILCAYDADSTGDQNAKALEKHDPRVERCRPKGAKDWNEIIQRRPRSPPVPAGDRMSPSSHHSGGGACRRQTSCPDSGKCPVPKQQQGRIARHEVQPHLLLRRLPADEPVSRTALQPAKPTPSVPRIATRRSPRPTRRREPRWWCWAIRRSPRKRSSGRASRITTSVTEGFRGKPSRTSNWQAENEMFRPHESESTSPKNAIALMPASW